MVDNELLAWMHEYKQCSAHYDHWFASKQMQIRAGVMGVDIGGAGVMGVDTDVATGVVCVGVLLRIGVFSLRRAN